MERDRDRDRRPSDRYAPNSDSTYRPARSPPPRDSYRSTRSPVPRRPLPADSYIPASSRVARPRSRSPGYRRRSRSPRGGGYGRPESDTWRARPRSPPRRAFSPRRDDYRRDVRARSPVRETYDAGYDRRSPPRSIRERSPLPLKRSRDVSPAGSRGRSPLPAKRERLASPPPRVGRYEEPRSRPYSPPPRRAYSPPRDTRNYRPRSRSPRRDDRAEAYVVDNWRRRSPSPPRVAYDAGIRSGRESVTSSRRSSPPVHPSRLGLVVDERPPVVESYSPRPRSPYRPRSRERERERSPPRRRDPLPPVMREREYSNGGPPPSGPRNGDFSRAPPTGPSGGSRSYSHSAMSPPLGPSSTAMPMSAHNRSSNPILSAPSQPRRGGRGGFGDRGGFGGRGGFGDREYAPYDASPGPRRGMGGPWPPRGGGPGYHGSPPAGPRGASGPPGFGPPFRGSSNSTSTTYPRTQRFNQATNHLADLPQVVPGGQKQKDLVDSSRLQKLEEETRRLREAIAEKEATTRRGQREWDRLERETENSFLRAELADEHLGSLNGEGELGGAAF